MTSSAAPQAQAKNAELERALAMRATKTFTAVKEDPFANIKASPVFQAVYSPEIKPEEKPAALAAILAKPQTEAEARETLKSLEQVMEYTAAQREELAVAMIKVQQSATQEELQRSINDLNNGMLQFENLLKPCTEVIDAIYALSLNDKAYDAFKEIKRDQAHDLELKVKRDGISKRVNEITEFMSKSEKAIADHKKNTNWLGNIKKDSQDEIASLTTQRTDGLNELEKLRKDLEEVTAETGGLPSELSPELVSSKAVIAKFMNLSNTEVKEQQEALFKAALDFIKTNKDRVGNMRKLLDTDGQSITKMVDASEMLGMIYATVADACNLTSDQLKDRRNALLPKEGEVFGEVEKKIRNNKLKMLDSYIESFEKNKGNTLQTVGKVTELQEKLGNLKRSNSDGQELTRMLHTDAIAEVSEGLTTTLTSLSTAAIGQSAEIAKNNLKRMNALTNDTAQKDSIRGAMGEEKRVVEARETIESMKGWTDIVNTRKGILEGTFGRMKETVAELQDITKAARLARDEAASVAAKVATSDVLAEEPVKAPDSILDLTATR